MTEKLSRKSGYNLLVIIWRVTNSPLFEEDMMFWRRTIASSKSDERSLLNVCAVYIHRSLFGWLTRANNEKVTKASGVQFRTEIASIINSQTEKNDYIVVVKVCMITVWAIIDTFVEYRWYDDTKLKLSGPLGDNICHYAFEIRITSFWRVCDPPIDYSFWTID